MYTISIIAVILSVAAIAVALSVRSEVRKFRNKMTEMEREQASINNLLRGVELRVDDLENDDGHIVYPSLGGAVYDENTGTMTVFGNIKAEGWISCKTIKED